MTAETTDIAPKKPGMGRRIVKGVMLLVGASALMGAGFGAGYFYFANPLSPNKDILTLLTPPEDTAPSDGTDPNAPLGEDGKPMRLPKPTPEKELFVTSYYTFPDAMTTNLAGSRRFLQLSVGLSTTYDETVIKNAETHQLALKSDILAVLASFTEEQATTKEGRDQLAAEIRDAVNARLEQLEGFGGIENVFFPGFVLQ